MAGRPENLTNKGKGRKLGSVNKASASAKEAFRLAFEGLGGADALREWAEENQTEFFKLYARLIPTEVSGPDGAPIAVQQTWLIGGKPVTF